MKNMSINRREMLRGAALLGGASVIGILGNGAFSFGAEDKPAQDAVAKLGWRIGPQIYSFNRFPFDVAIKKVKETGSTSFELYSGQQLRKVENGRRVAVGPGLAGDDYKYFQDLIAETGCKPHAMGVCPADRAHFEFAVKLGLSVLNVEPKFDKIPEVNKLAEEYKIKVGLHNHPRPSIYWDPDIVLGQLKDSGKWVGACCDTGHWLRSGLDPLECVKKFKGRIVSFHIKDLSKKDKNFVFVPLGAGDCKIAEILREVATQEVKIPFSIEYEAEWDNNVKPITESVEFFRKTASSLATK
ncbi:MAG: sugar phosphate isomerase/epimerase [Planctomycetaceae bacterium]|jgi:sugar phosphate isomerase/epimerase|nr:sugar phosphate isomerase/epimerase [Planctomycetaceae bacterium]